MIAEAIVVGNLMEYDSKKNILYLGVEYYNFPCQQDEFRCDFSIIPISLKSMYLNRYYLTKIRRNAIIGIRGRIIIETQGIEIECKEITYICDHGDCNLTGMTVNDMDKIHFVKEEYDESKEDVVDGIPF